MDIQRYDEKISEKFLNCDYRIMILGVTGAGKSTVCNFFLGEEAFAAEMGQISITTKSQAQSGNVSGQKVLFIDTPGFSDAYQSNEERVNDLGVALHFAQNGIHSLGICFDGGSRYDIAAEKAVKKLSSLGTFWPHAFILYTHAEDMGDTEDERREVVHQWLKEERCAESLKDLFKNVSHRFLTVESRSDDKKYHEQKCKELLELVNEIYEKNSRILYTNEMFKMAKQEYDKAVQEKKKQKEEIMKTQKDLNDYKEKLKELEQLSKHNQAMAQEIQKQNAEIERLMQKNSELQAKYNQSVHQTAICNTTGRVKKRGNCNIV